MDWRGFFHQGFEDVDRPDPEGPRAGGDYCRDHPRQAVGAEEGKQGQQGGIFLGHIVPFDSDPSLLCKVLSPVAVALMQLALAKKKFPYVRICAEHPTCGRAIAGRSVSIDGEPALGISFLRIYR